MFEHWGEFFLLLGGASGALIGLLFVVTTLAASTQIGRVDLARGQALYMTPTLFHFATVLVLSAVGTVPGISGKVMATIVALWALIGTGYGLSISVLIRKRQQPDAGRWSDMVTYGMLPTVVFLALLGMAGSAWVEQSNAAYILGFALLALTIVAIRNAWDLVSFIAPRANGA
jgi:hypothetical protein